ncbi:Protein of unknown function [Gryllus bimaculatus]|nr:Protein of unknown function [Gryllus bimaculatus]
MSPEHGRFDIFVLFCESVTAFLFRLEPLCQARAATKEKRMGIDNRETLMTNNIEEQELNSKANRCVPARPYTSNDPSPTSSPAGTSASNASSSSNVSSAQEVQQRWLRRWLPPGLPSSRVSSIWVNVTPHFLNPVVGFPVRSSAAWDPLQLANASFWQGSVVFDGDAVVRRNPHTGRVARTARYCVDSMQHPDVAFALLLHSWCVPTDYGTLKCCDVGFGLVARNGSLKCERQAADSPRSAIRFSSVMKYTESCRESVPMRWDPVSPKEASETDFCINPYKEDFVSQRNFKITLI